METQRIAGESADYIVLQARTAGGKWKQTIGMDKAITVRFIKQSFNSVCMEIGEAKWADKGAAMARLHVCIVAFDNYVGDWYVQTGHIAGEDKNAADRYVNGV